MIFDTLTSDQQNLIKDHLDLVIEKNKTLNLTRIDTEEKGMLLHIEDSLSCLPEFQEQDGLFLDIGTGGGFPGIPLAIASGRDGVLIDSVQKKAKAVQEMIDELCLEDQLEAIGVRSEEYAQDIGPIFSTVVARAVSSLPVLEELAYPLLENRGRLIALRGNETEESLEEAVMVGDRLGYKLISNRPLMLDDQYERNIIVFEKIGESEIVLPRRPGMAQKRPIKPSR